MFMNHTCQSGNAKQQTATGIFTVLTRGVADTKHVALHGLWLAGLGQCC